MWLQRPRRSRVKDRVAAGAPEVRGQREGVLKAPDGPVSGLGWLQNNAEIPLRTFMIPGFLRACQNREV